ncbi:MAG: MBL fold metallo-hydrolase [Deferribacteraceae bacterium]|jgi:phosphoribosyl 1,2-cyclic phosphodiesterase|nr:MBL fold metallo-hydrolase [Deferribacteraceae bacterium]
MKLHVLSSGSSGNSYCAETDTDMFFVDIGVSTANVKKYLGSAAAGKTISLFVTHEHVDHIKGITPFINAFRPKIYTSAGTAEYLARMRNVPRELLFPLATDVYYNMDSFAITPFNVSHDAEEPFGCKLMTSCGNIGFLTDIGCVTQEQLTYMEDVDVLVLEANHDEHLLKKSRYPQDLKKRIASHKGHLSNNAAAAVVTALHGGRLNHCLFAHVSEENNDYRILEELGIFCKEQFGVNISVLRQKNYTSYEVFQTVRGGSCV